MAEVLLQAERRDVIGKQVKALRRAGRLPAVLYGRHLEAPIAISLDYRSASRLLPTLSSAQLVIVVVGSERHTALVREKQRHPVHSALLHVDFQAVSLTEKLRTLVPVVLEGEAPVVFDLGGILVHTQESLEVECLPGDLPERINVSVTGLRQIGDVIHVRDVAVPQGVEVLTSGDEIVVVVTAQAAEELEPAGSAAEPEVIERGKKEEDF